MLRLMSAQVPVREDLLAAVADSMAATARPGPTLSGAERVALASAARGGTDTGTLSRFADHLYRSPATVTVDHVREAAQAVGEPMVVESIGVVARLASVDRLTTVMGVGLEALPEPLPGGATGAVVSDLRRRRGHLPMPPGPIPVALDMVPSEAEAFRAMFGPFYMTEEEMADPHFTREPGLNTPQLETIAARISLLNRCFY